MGRSEVEEQDEEGEQRADAGEGGESGLAWGVRVEWWSWVGLEARVAEGEFRACGLRARPVAGVRGGSRSMGKASGPGEGSFDCGVTSGYWMREGCLGGAFPLNDDFSGI